MHVISIKGYRVQGNGTNIMGWNHSHGITHL